MDCNPLCKNPSSKCEALVPYQTKSPGLFRLKKPPPIIDMPIGTPHGTLDYKQVSKVTFVGASSNTVIDTTTGSLGVGVGVGGPTSNLHVVGNALITGNVSDLNVVSNVNMLHTANTAAIKLNSNVVAEFPRSKKLIRYPRVALTSAAQSSAGDYEGYIVNQSSVYSSENSHGAYKSFRGNEHWLSSSNSFDGGNDVFNETNGPWISIQLPTKIKLEYLEFSAGSGRLAQLITAGSVYASNNGSTWINIGSLDNLGTYTNIVPAHVDFTHTTLYDRYLLHITANGTNYVHMEKLSLYGVPEYDPEAHGTDVTVKSVANVPNTDWLEVYYDAKDLEDTTSISTITGLGGTTISGSILGNPQVSNEAFVFDGSGDAIVSGATSLINNPPLSYSVWFKTNSIISGSNSIVAIGYAVNYKSIGIRIQETLQTYRFYVYSGATNESVNTDIKAELGKWTHATVVYDGLNSKLYIDGQFAVENTNTSTNLALNSGARVALGNYIDVNGNLHDATRSYNGSIANFRLFNRALTSDEIYQLYAYQKEYFGLGDLSMTLKAGRLGIGTSEPKAALDVRGDIHGGCPVLFDCVASSTTNVGSYMNWNLVKLNKGGGLSGTTFTAPVKGHYFFHVHVMGVWTSSSGDVRFLMEWHKNGAHYGITSELDAQMYDGRDDVDSDNAHLKLSGSIIAHLEIGDTIKIIVPSNASMGVHGRYNRFTGHYIG